MKKVEQKNEGQEAASENKEPNALVITIKLAEAIAAYLLDQKMSDVEVSKLLLRINEKFPGDIEEHFGARNIID